MKMYTNPIRKQGDFADPFVLRHNGRYYLYCTNPCVSCWSGDDLVHWQPEGPVVPEEEFPGLVPFAPEVVYENGWFYLYTSPHGLGHYVLQSDSPLGPFRKITPNIGHSIDFSVFLDEDGKRYAYWADNGGILGCEMPTPSAFGTPRLVGAYLHGWTEGPFVVKEKGSYHLTYTGNHYLSKGYRIHEAMSRHPLGPYQDNPRNPIVVRTEGGVVGLGHSSTVIGPDLISRYLVYHNLNPDRTRDLNIDRILLAEGGSYVLGPTDTPQPAPAPPTFADTEGQAWDVLEGQWQAQGGMRTSRGAFACRCRETLPGRGAVECNLRAGERDTQNYGIRLMGEDGALTLRISREEGAAFLEQKETCVARLPLAGDFAHEALHCVRLTLEDGVTAHLDHLLVGRMDWHAGGAALAYWSDGPMGVGYTAFSNGSEDRPCYPVPAALPKLSAFSFCAAKAGEHVLALEKEGASKPAFWVDDEPLERERMRCGGHMRTATVRLPQGIHTLRLEGARATAVYPMPASSNATLRVEAFGPDAKRCEGPCFDDGECAATLVLGERKPGWEAGVLLRATELADGGEGDDPVLGRDFLIGYRVSVDGANLSLWKHRYDKRLLTQAPIPVGGAYSLRVSFCADRIRVWLNGEERLAWTDEEPILYGRTGFDVRDCMLREATLVSQA